MPEPTSPRIVALIGAPTDIGAGHRGASMGPEALRVAGLAEALREASLALSATLDFARVLDRLLEQVARVVPCDRPATSAHRAEP